MGLVHNKIEEVASTSPEMIISDSTLTAKDRRIMAQGTIQAAMQSQAIFSHSTNFVEWWALVETASKKAMKFIEENSK